MEVINERETAVFALIDIEAGGYNNLVLKKTLQKNNAMTKVQKAFVTETVNGVLRNLYLIDHIINFFSKTHTEKMKPFIRNCLRLGVYQLRFMDRVPASAACNEAVNLTKKKGFVNLSGFVNGVLRSIARNGDNVSLPDEKNKPFEFLSVSYSYPIWMVEKFVGIMGYDETKRMFEINNTAPLVSLCVNTLKTTPEKLTEKLKSEGVSVSDGSILKNALRVSKTSDISKLPSYNEGHFHVMDESAMLAVLAADPRPKQIIIDLCAAPGGKSFFSAYLSGDSSEIISRDLFPHKIELIKSGANRLNLKSVKTYEYDATKNDKDLNGKADVVFADLPCSGLGLIRKKPDIKLGKKQEDIAELVELQKKILSASWQYVKPGGVLIYSTCTLTGEENEKIIDWFVDSFSFKIDDISKSMHYNVKLGDRIISNKGFIKILPQDYETDGFFIARLVREN